MRPQIVGIDTTKPFGQMVWDYGETRYREGTYVGFLYGISFGILIAGFLWVKLSKR